MIPIGIPVRVFVKLCGNTVDDQIAFRVAIQAANDVQKRGFPAAGRSENGYKFMFPEINIDTAQSVYLTVARQVGFDNIFLFAA